LRFLNNLDLFCCDLHPARLHERYFRSEVGQCRRQLLVFTYKILGAMHKYPAISGSALHGNDWAFSVDYPVSKYSGFYLRRVRPFIVRAGARWFLAADTLFWKMAQEPLRYDDLSAKIRCASLRWGLAEEDLWKCARAMSVAIYKPYDPLTLAVLKLHCFLVAGPIYGTFKPSEELLSLDRQRRAREEKERLARSPEEMRTKALLDRLRFEEGQKKYENNRLLNEEIHKRAIQERLRIENR
jgi:hypothetical protein